MVKGIPRRIPCVGDNASRVISNPHGRRKCGNDGVAARRSGCVCHPLPDPGLTLACHGIAALCITPLHADFGVEIAGTMQIVLSVFSKIRITMAFAQLTHSRSFITLSLSL